VYIYVLAICRSNDNIDHIVHLDLFLCTGLFSSMTYKDIRGFRFFFFFFSSFGW